MVAYRRIDFSSPSLSYAKTLVHVDVLEKNPQLSPRVSWNVGGRHFYSTDCAKCFADLKYRAMRTSILENSEVDKGLMLASPEHLAPVFLMWPNRRFDVNLADAACPEIPMMDGSALKFFCELRKVAGTPEELAFYDAPVTASWELFKEGCAEAYGYVRISPSETFEVEYVLDRPDVDGFTSAAHVAVYSAEDLYNVFMARTFIFEKDYESLRKAGMLAGVDESCGLLLRSSDLQKGNVSNAYRIADEPARHKILDLLGDLAFVMPALPKVRLEILNGGHASHRQILEKVLPYALR